MRLSGLTSGEDRMFTPSGAETCARERSTTTFQLPMRKVAPETAVAGGVPVEVAVAEGDAEADVAEAEAEACGDGEELAALREQPIAKTAERARVKSSVARAFSGRIVGLSAVEFPWDSTASVTQASLIAVSSWEA